MANVSDAGPQVIWKNPKNGSKRDWFTSRAADGAYEVRQQLDSGRWTLVAVFTIVRRAA
jgi:hypothetical protein